MAVDRPLGQGPVSVAEPSVEIEIANPESVSVETPDGGMLIDFDPQAGEEDVSHDANLAEHLEESDLRGVASELVSAYQSDRESRSDWEETYINGLDLLGLKHEDRTVPWDGACGVFHPLLTESVVRFQAQAIQELFPASGPVKTTVVGTLTSEKQEQADRVKNYLNYLITERMTEYRSETEKMLFSLPLAGSAFRKVYYDPNLGRPCSMFVPAEDFVVSYGAPDLTTCERATHVMKRSKNEVRKLQVSGFYLDVELPSPSPDTGEIERKYNELTGDSANYDMDSRHTILEIQADLDLPGFEDTEKGEETGIALPYVVSIDKSSRTVLAIRRNWYEDDPLKIKREHFVHYQYMPGLGFYGFGLIHLIGGLAKSATSLLRQLVDAGTLSNLPGGLKSRGLRIKGDDTPIMPGEFRDVDVPGGTIRDNISFLPYKEPSNVLYQMLGDIVEEGRRFASAADVKVADMNAEAPVGTTLALLERQMKVMSAVQARMHASMRKELRILSGVVHDFGPTEYPYEETDGEVTREDFDDRVDIIPVSDPNAGTMAQRIMQYQAALQLAVQAPEMYDLPLLHRQMLEVLGIQDVDNIIPSKEALDPVDPVGENMAIINSKPVKAFIYQDHEAHIQTHLAVVQDPKLLELLSKSPNANVIEGAMAAHLSEHLAFQYRHEIEKELGVPLPPPEEKLPEDIEYRLSQLVAPAAAQLLDRDKKEAEMEKRQEEAEDPILQIQRQELEIKRESAQGKAQAEMAKINLDREKLANKDQLDREKMSLQERIERAKLGARIAAENSKGELESRKIASKEEIEGVKIGVDIAKDLMGE
ncbi:hypothetical protein [Halopseudomonas pelagia]|uniref:hypothetical protein n=1 Tax=Halopseudomonas pelagia TaxID=553151 RepID=UPI0030D8C669|tara:strand:+ start:597 stop:3053 length:2457 start_codon:yes stop_codon:yes gene_type:complete